MNTRISSLARENQSFFELVPCCIAVIDKELRVVDSNRMLRDIYGNVNGQACYRSLKGRETVCSSCVARNAFSSKTTQQENTVWLSPDGKFRNYQVTAVPLKDEDGKVCAIMEMAVDITTVTELLEQDEKRKLMLTEIVHNSLRGLVLIDDNGDIPFINPTLVQLLNLPAIGAANAEEIYAVLPEEVNRAISSGVDEFCFIDLLLFPERGAEAIPVNLKGLHLRSRGISLGLLLGFHDLREIKKLTRAKMDSERMAAVGQTVSGLSHGIKNLVTALEGGMYMLNSGMKTANSERMAQGIDMLQRNITRISGVVKDFLKFARGREIRTTMCDPAAVLREVVEQFKVKATQQNIDLRLEVQDSLAEAPLDYECLHDSLSNFVVNALDACAFSEKDEALHVIAKLFEKDGILVYEISDNGCGMDTVTKSKVFSNFFTTKGANGTGLGLLMSKKNIQAHGGSIEFESQNSLGSTFRILLPRRELSPLVPAQ